MVGSAAVQKTRTEDTVAPLAIPVLPNFAYIAIDLYLEQSGLIAKQGRAWMEILKPVSVTGF